MSSGHQGGRVYKLKLYLDRITINDTTCYSFPGFGTSHTTCAYGDHNHSGVYEPSITKSIGFLKWSGSAWFFDPSVYSPASHNHDGTYEPVIPYGRDGQYWDGNKTWRELNAGAVGLGNVSNIAQVTSVTGTAPVYSTGGTNPDISMPQATTSQSGYLSYLDWQTFNNKVSSQWTPNGFDLYYMKGKVGIGLTNPAYTSDVYGTANVYDYKSAENYVSKLNIKQGNASLSGIWSSATDSVPSKMPTKDISEEKSSGYIYNTSFIANPFLGAYMYFYSRDYNYQVGLFDRMGHKKAFCGIMGGGMPTQPYVNLGSTGYPWGKGYFADSLSTQKISSTGISASFLNTTGNIGIGTTAPTGAVHAEISTGVASFIASSTCPIQAGSGNQSIAQMDLRHINTTTAYARNVLRYNRDVGHYEFLQTLYAHGATRAFQWVDMFSGRYEMRAGVTDAVFYNTGYTSFGAGGGNFGIGTFAPAAKLHVATAGLTTDLFKVINNKGAGTDSSAVVNSRGFIGVGTTNPANYVHTFNGNGGSSVMCEGTWSADSQKQLGAIFFKNSSSGDYGGMMMRKQVGGSNEFIFTTYRSSNATWSEFIFFDQYAQKLTLGRSSMQTILQPVSGNVGIGTTNATAKLHVASDIIRIETPKTPASCTAAGNTGDICWDDKYVYVCVATNIWRRSATSTW
ncbi:MAG: hypothetical protein NTW16_04710 [Bacteroidetes bacterium]|nr:hypothetical protein [Bacteroidota bacterium]